MELYNHIDVEEMKKVEKEVQVKRTWFTEKMQAQQQLPKCVIPAVTVTQIGKERQVKECSKPVPVHAGWCAVDASDVKIARTLATLEQNM